MSSSSAFYSIMTAPSTGTMAAICQQLGQPYTAGIGYYKLSKVSHPRDDNQHQHPAYVTILAWFVTVGESVSQQAGGCPTS